ncbi:hypothetical protein FH972_024367 [Carpinus fangiana]|uniref:1-phosphatidylinositol-4-phosphate 5-kinase n=1 Tax=Carpinus fangiana TaxID=176857 RepID=A0A5N6KXU5_9ROSI|nr:hypothetical protein FH972_024367 [Carpinus fangiana]
MPLILSEALDGSPSLHGTSSVVIKTMKPHTNGSPKLPPLETSGTNGSAFLPPGALFASPTHSPSQSPVTSALKESHKSFEAPNAQATSYPPSTALRLQPPDAASPGLRVPSTSHRLSSPPRFGAQQASLNSPVADSPQKPTAPRLQHRHTLEVPTRGVPRASRESGRPGSGVLADEFANGRLSPQTPQAKSGSRRGSLTLGRRTSRSAASDLHLDDVPQDDDAVRWAEAIRQKRASKRRRKEEEDDDRVVVGTKVDQNHVNWVTAYNMLTGIRFTVSRTNAKMDRELTSADFAARHKFSFDITGNELTPSAKYDFKFKDYAPWVFRHLRGIFKLDPADYLVSLTSKYILSELGSPGKSGSFFYFSRDYKYIIKTIHHAEHKFLRRILKDYYNHVQENPNTLLSQFYGLHRVKIPYGRKIHFVVMNNLFPPHRDIHMTFDLKGSTVGRDFKEEELETHPRATLKDLNWLRRGMRLELGPTKKEAFVKQMERDVALLKRLKIMDYSLLIGIHDLTKGNDENLRDKTLQVFQPASEADEGAYQDHLLSPPIPATSSVLHNIPTSGTSSTFSLSHSATAPPTSNLSASLPGPGTLPQPGALARTPSKLEAARKAKELRASLKAQKPVPMSTSALNGTDGLSASLSAADPRSLKYFYADDGGFRATRLTDEPGDAVYYLGIIDCLTRYDSIKRGEHFFKSLMSRGKGGEISAIPPDKYGVRFVRFMNSIAVPKEEEPSSAVEQAQGALERASAEKEHGRSASGDSAGGRRSGEAPGRKSDERRSASIEGMHSSAGAHGGHTAPDRVRSTLEADRDGTTLPVVEETNETSSMADREKSRSRSRRRDLSRDASRDRRGQRTDQDNGGRERERQEQVEERGEALKDRLVEEEKTRLPTIIWKWRARLLPSLDLRRRHTVFLACLHISLLSGLARSRRPVHFCFVWIGHTVGSTALLWTGRFVVFLPKDTTCFTFASSFATGTASEILSLDECFVLTAYLCRPIDGRLEQGSVHSCSHRCRLDAANDVRALALELLAVPRAFLLLAVLEAGAAMRLEQAVLAAVVAAAEVAITHDSLGGLFAVFGCAADLLRWHYAWWSLCDRCAFVGRLVRERSRERSGWTILDRMWPCRGVGRGGGDSGKVVEVREEEAAECQVCEQCSKNLSLESADGARVDDCVAKYLGWGQAKRVCRDGVSAWRLRRCRAASGA